MTSFPFGYGKPQDETEVHKTFFVYFESPHKAHSRRPQSLQTLEEVESIDRHDYSKFPVFWELYEKVVRFFDR